MGIVEKLKAVENRKQESIVITNEWLQNKTVFMAMGDLLKGYYDQYTAYQLEKLSRRLNQAQKSFAAASEAIIKKYTVIDKNGQPERKMEAAVDAEGNAILNSDGTPKVIPVDFMWKDVTEKNEQGEDITSKGSELANIEFANLGAEEITFDVFKFNRSDFAGAKLTVAQWMALNPIIADPYTDEV